MMKDERETGAALNGRGLRGKERCGRKVASKRPELGRREGPTGRGRRLGGERS